MSKVVEKKIVFTNGSTMKLSSEAFDHVVAHLGGPLGWLSIDIEPEPVTPEIKRKNLEFQSLVGIMNAKQVNNEGGPHSTSGIDNPDEEEFWDLLDLLMKGEEEVLA